MLEETKQEIIRMTTIGRPYKWQAEKLNLPEGEIRRIGNQVPREERAASKSDIPTEENVFATATQALTKIGRYRQSRGFMWLDGKVASLDEVMREFNLMQVKRGYKQIGRNPKWFV
jgi:hypothetical protein